MAWKREEPLRIYSICRTCLAAAVAVWRCKFIAALNKTRTDLIDSQMLLITRRRGGREPAVARLPNLLTQQIIMNCRRSSYVFIGVLVPITFLTARWKYLNLIYYVSNYYNTIIWETKPLAGRIKTQTLEELGMPIARDHKLLATVVWSDKGSHRRLERTAVTAIPTYSSPSSFVKQWSSFELITELRRCATYFLRRQELVCKNSNFLATTPPYTKLAWSAAHAKTRPKWKNGAETL